MNYCGDLFSLPESLLAKRAFFEIDTGRSLTFGELRSSVLRWSAALRARGIGPGNSVAIHLHNGIDFILAHMAAQHLGAISCLLDPLAQPKSLPYFVEKTRATLLFTHLPEDSLPDAVRSAAAVVDPRAFEREADEAPMDAAPQGMHSWPPDTTCYIYFTSGTTSAPKGVPLTQANHANFFRIADKYWQPSDENSKHIGFVPFSHGFGSVFLIPWTIRTRSELHILRSFHPAKVLDTVSAVGITHIYGVPSHYQQLLRLPENHARLAGIEMAFCAAAKLDIGTCEEWEKATGTLLHEGYGLIETTGGTVWRVHQKSRGTGHMGECPDTSLIEIGILDEDGNRLARGSEGEIAVRGKSVTSGYLDMPEENARTFHDGWFRTGDKGCVSEDGHLFMTGRIKDIINIAGIKISPFEVESVLNEHPDVSEAVVVSSEDPLYGEVVKAFVVAAPGRAPTERELVKYASQHLINFQVPKRIEFVESFPLNNMGKVDRKALRTR